MSRSRVWVHIHVHAYITSGYRSAEIRMCLQIQNVHSDTTHSFSAVQVQIFVGRLALWDIIGKAEYLSFRYIIFTLL